MARYVIIEDEPFACDEIKRMMARLRPCYELAGWAQTVGEAVELAGEADLLIADIRLQDGMCFDAFERQQADTPVIFTTAYDEYALKAFKLNSVDYLLKPVDEGELEQALRKFERNALATTRSERYAGMAELYLRHTRKNRFLIRIGDEFRHVSTADVAFFYSEDKATFLCTFSGRRYVVDYSLEQVADMVCGNEFCRVSRGCVANIKAVARVSRYFGGRLRITLSPECPQDVIVSRGRVSEVLGWLDA